ncbi:MAG: hypothetical protein ABSE18_01715 [Minisyncoccia bacterium]
MEKIPDGMLNSEAERYFSTLLEQLNGKFDHLLEIVFSLDSVVGGLKIRIERLEERVTMLETNAAWSEMQRKETERELNKIKGMVQFCVRRADFSALQQRVADIDQRFLKFNNSGIMKE